MDTVKNDFMRDTNEQRPQRNTHNERRGMSVRKPRNTDDGSTGIIKIEAPTFIAACDPHILSDWLVNIDYYFDWNDKSNECKILLLG